MGNGGGDESAGPQTLALTGRPAPHQLYTVFRRAGGREGFEVTSRSEQHLVGESYLRKGWEWK